MLVAFTHSLAVTFRDLLVEIPDFFLKWCSWIRSVRVEDVHLLFGMLGLVLKSGHAVEDKPCSWTYTLWALETAQAVIDRFLHSVMRQVTASIISGVCVNLGVNDEFSAEIRVAQELLCSPWAQGWVSWSRIEPLDAD